MPSFDVKKIITSFILLAFGAGLASFIFSSIPSSPSTAKNTAITASASAPEKNSSASSLPAESLPADTFSGLSSSPQKDGGTGISTSSNLTDQLTATLAQSFIQANPTGPQVDDDGKKKIEFPSNFNNVLKEQLTAATLKFVPVTIESERLKIQKNYKPEDLQKYFEATKQILDSSYVSAGIATLAKNNAEPKVETVAAVNLVLSEAEQKLYTVPVPAPLETLHRALLNYVAYQKTVFDPALETDPVKSLALAQNYDATVSFHQGNIRAALDELVKNPPALKNAQTGLLEKVFLPQTAYAFIFTDWVNAVFNGITSASTSATWLQKLGEWVVHQLLVILKQQIIHRLVMQTVNWINTGFKGAPQFVTNWQNFLDDVGNNAAGVAISNLTNPPGQLCSSFGPLITLQLRQQYLNYIPPTCTLDRVINNVENFYQSFENGGWIAYGALTVPTGNYYGSMLQAQIAVSQKISKDLNANTQKTQANKGFLSQDVCVEEAPHLKKTIHIEGIAGHPPVLGLNGQVISPYVPDVPAHDEQVDDTSTDPGCLDYETMTPGGVVAHSLDKSLADSPLDNIISADDIGALVDALINSAFNKLISAARSGLTGLLKGGSSPSTGAVTAGSGFDPCTGLTGDELNQCKGITGTTKVTAGSGVDIEPQKTSLSGQITGDLKNLNDQLDADRNWLSLAPSAKETVLAVADSCTEKADAANASAAVIDTMTSSIQDEVDAIAKKDSETCSDPVSWIKKFECVQGDIRSAKAADELDAALNLYNSYKAKTQNIIGVGVPRYQSLVDFKTAADQNLLGAPAAAACSPDLPSLTQ